MDTSNPELKKYIDNLVPAVKTAVSGSEWQKRVNEIGRKYSLNPDQIGSLQYEVLFVMIGMEPEDDFATNIEKEVGVSKILAMQIAEEVDTRVFQYILKMTQDKPAPKAEQLSQPAPQPLRPNTTILNYSAAPVTPAPPSLLSEMETMAGKVSVEHHLPKMTEPPANLPGEIEEVTAPQKPIIISTMGNIITPPTTPSTTPVVAPKTSIADTKLNAPVTSVQQQTVVNESIPQTQVGNPITHEYTSDPYREPLE